MKALLPWGFWAFAAFFVVTSPSDAAALVHTAFGWLGQIGTGFSDFVSQTTGSA
jgi:hypothetical protein